MIEATLPALSAPPRLVVLLSGSGRTLQNFIDRIANGRFTADIVAVVASRSDAYGLERARLAGIPGHVDSGKNADTFWANIRATHPDFVVLAGWLKKLTIPIDFRFRVLNIHPSLLPAHGGQGMYGHHVHEAVLAAKETTSGCTVHFADDTYDTGPIILQKSVLVDAHDTPEILAKRVFEAECEAYPEAIRDVSSGGFVKGGRWMGNG